MQSYRWPGNVRELQNVIERAVILAPGPVLEIGEELRWGPGLGTTKPAPEPAPESLNADQPRPEKTLVEVERTHIRRVLEQTGWRIAGASGAARILGLNPSTLRSRIKKLGIRKP